MIPEPVTGHRGDLASLLALGTAAQDLLFREAHTVTEFAARPVTDEQIQAVYELVKYAPTSMNQQPMRIVLLRSPEARRDLLPHVSTKNRAKVAAVPLIALLAADLHFHESLPRLFPDASAYAKRKFADPDVRRQSAIFNTTLQVAYFIVGIRAAGLAAWPMGGYDAGGVNRTFFDDGNKEIVTVVNIGHADKAAQPSRMPRLAFEEVVTIA